MNIFYPIQLLADWLTFSVFSITPETIFYDAVNFFIYDSIKIFFLLLIMTLLMGVVRIYLPIQKIRDLLMNKRWFGMDYLLAATFGAITPFCSCSQKTVESRSCRRSASISHFNFVSI